MYCSSVHFADEHVDHPLQNFPYGRLRSQFLLCTPSRLQLFREPPLRSCQLLKCSLLLNHIQFRQLWIGQQRPSHVPRIDNVVLLSSAASAVLTGQRGGYRENGLTAGKQLVDEHANEVIASPFDRPSDVA